MSQEKTNLRLKFWYDIPPERQGDVERIVATFYDQGYIVKETEAYAAWIEHSLDTSSTGRPWIPLPESDQDILLAIEEMFEVE